MQRLHALEVQLGLNKPAVAQYWTWLTGVLHGNFGTSLANGQPERQLEAFGDPAAVVCGRAAEPLAQVGTQAVGRAVGEQHRFPWKSRRVEGAT